MTKHRGPWHLPGSIRPKHHSESPFHVPTGSEESDHRYGLLLFLVGASIVTVVGAILVVLTLP